MTKAASKWKPGQAGNPKGRSRGAGEIGKLRESIARHVPEIISRLVEKAMDGDPSAARLLLERVLPAVKPAELAVSIALPAGTLSDQGRAILAAAGTGALAPGASFAAAGRPRRAGQADRDRRACCAHRRARGQAVRTTI